MKKIFLLSILFISIQSMAQQNEPAYKAMMQDNSINFYDVCNVAETYFKTIDKTKKGSGYKPYSRWKAANEYKYFPTGDRSAVDPFFVEKEFIKFKDNNSTAQNKLFPNGWEDLGPYSIDSITGHYAAGLGRVEDVYIDPNNTNTIYIGSRSGGFWKTNDGGNTWAGNTTDFLLASGVNTISASPTNSDSVLINVRNANNGMSHGIYRSINGGTTWTQSNFNPTTVGFGGLGSYFFIYEVAYHPRVHDLVFVATSRGIYRSTDNLQTWTQLYGSNTVREIEFHPTDDNIIYIVNSSFSNAILISTDQGLSYNSSNTLVGNNTWNIKISTTPACPNCVYTASNDGVWRSLDSGQNFTLLSTPSQSCDAFVVSDLDTSNMIYGNLDLERSTDGGQNFNQATFWSLGNSNGAGNGLQTSYFTSTDYIHADLRNARCVNGVYYVTTDGFLCKSTDNGVNWQILSNNIGIRENYRLGLSQSNHRRVVCGSQDNGTSIHTEIGWVEFYGADGMEAVVHPTNDDWMVTSLQYGGRRRTLNGGTSQGSGKPDGSPDADWLAPLAIDPNNQMVVYDFREAIYKSTDFADNHTIIGTPSFGANIKQAAIAENNSNIIIVARNSAIEKSTDGGVTFSSIKNNLPIRSITDIAFDPKNDDVIIVTYGDYNANNSKVYITTNGGSTWSNITYNLGDMPIRSVVIDHTNDANIYLGAEIGVYTKPMNGTTWTLFNTDLPNVAVLELDINYGSNTLKAATWGRGLWEYNIVGRKDYPAIITTENSSPPTLDKPKKGVDQLVTSVISYDNTLSAVYCEWSTSTPTFGNIIPMTNTVDSTWVTTSPLPDVAVGTKMFFKVFAVGDNNDTTETYKFMYEQHPFDYCAAMGDSASGNLYLENVTIENINNNTNNNLYTNYTNPWLTLYADSTYNLDVTANTGWGENDYGAWIDFNSDAEFTQDEIILWEIGPGQSNVNNTFTVPNNARAGDTVTMRIRLSYWGQEPRPCGTQFGEVEDYNVILKTNGQAIGIEDITKANQIKLYPNPTTGKIYLDFADANKYDYLLKSQIGQLIEKGTLDNQNNVLDISTYAAGVYFLQVEDKVFKVFKRD